MKRTTVRLPNDLIRRAKRRSAETGRTLTSLLEDGLKTVLAETTAPTRKPIRLPISKATGGTLPGVDLNRSADLEDRMQSL
ncbi:MAG: hypothetical protein ACXW32_10795 [Limisphaerales bacterium]